MDKSRIVKRIKDLAKEHGRTPGEPGAEGIRFALASLYDLLAKAPRKIYDCFSDLDPADLDAVSENGAAAILKGDLGWEAEGSAFEVLRAAARQLRALDAALLASRAGYARPTHPESAWAVPKLGLYVVPRRRLPRRTESGAGLSFSRNALRFHRVYPARLGDAKVRFRWLDLHSEPDQSSQDRPLGAALFKSFRLVLGPTGQDGRFRVVDTCCHEPEQTVEFQVREALRNHCFAQLWPELSLTPELRRRVIDILRSELEQGHAPRIDLLVLGSWHEAGAKRQKAKASWHNQAQIVDGYGQHVAVHAKLMPYRGHRAHQFRLEDIDAGSEITCIVCEDQIVAVAICRDFCDIVGKTPYELLDVDLVLVPSHGNERTMVGHRRRAAALMAKFGGQVFVVQHTGAALPGGSGLVLRPSEDFEDNRACVVQGDVWARYPQLTDP